jgi:26S proteasome regulatory subunit N2
LTISLCLGALLCPVFLFPHNLFPAACSESLYEDEEFVQRQLAALVASKVFFYLGELNDALSYALGAGPLFDVSDDSDYAQTLLGEELPGACIMAS